MAIAFLIVVALLLANALYVAAEFAAVSARRTRIREAAESGNRTARWIMGILDDGRALDRYVACCQVGITLSSLVVGAYAQATLAPRLGGWLEGVLGSSEAAALATASTITLVALTAAQVVAGELVPKSIALQFPTGAALYTAMPMRVSLWVLRPLIALLNGSGILLLRVMGAPTEGHRHIHSPQEISLLIAESHDGGLLSDREQERLDRALRLSLLPVRRLMIPRLDIVGVDGSWTLREAQEHLVDNVYTRLPVYRGTLDTVVGVVHAKEVARRLAAGEADRRVEEVMRPIATVPESMRAERLVAELRRQRSEQAIVFDEHGGVAGLVTLEDLLGEVLADPRATQTGQNVPEPLPDGRVRLPGRLRVDEAREWLGFAWHGDSDTVGGMVSESLGHIPDPGERLEIDGVEVEVEQSDGVVVQSVLARPLPSVVREASS